jgi:exosortase D (VPLPA-CTERM-specific)
LNILILRNLSLKPGHVLLFQGAVAALLYLLIYAPLLPGLVRDWYEHDNFSYGFLIPFIFIYLLWQKREILRNTPVSASSWGALSLLAAVVIGLTGKVMGDSFTLRLSMILALGGLAHLLLGKHQIKILLFPLAYLLLMIPPPYLVVKEISYYLRFFDAVLATSALQAMGIPVYQDSYFLHLPNITLEVADICSGISSLFAMVAAGVFYINSLPVRPSSKAVIMVGALLFPVLANLFRIVLISAIVYYFGPAILQSFFHQFTGTFTFLLSIVVLVVLGEYLRRKSPRIASATSLHQSNGIGADGLRASGHPHPPARLLSRAFLSALAILALAWYLGNSLETRQPIALRKDLQELPVQFGAHFLAANGNWSDSYQDPNAETAVSRIYEGPGKEPVELYVGYRSSQHDRARLLSPKMHFPDGWNYVSIHPAQIEISGAEPIKANWMVIQKNEAKRLVLYWYQARGRSFSGEISNHFVQVRSLIQDGRTEGAVVRITTPVWGDENLKQAQERIRDFSGHVYLELAEILPDGQQSGQHRQLPE